MKENIHVFNETIKEELMGCRKEERAIRAYEKDLEKRKAILEKKKEAMTTRGSAINEIRLEKIAEIDHELEESKKELQKLKKEREQLLYAYCEKKGHHYVTISDKCLGDTGRHTFHGSIYLKEVKQICTVCGTVRSYCYEGSPSWNGNPKYEQNIPEELYDDATLREDGKTYRMILKEIEKLEQYIPYLQSLYGKICELFGHDAEIEDSLSPNEMFKCKCCKKLLSYKHYINDHYRAKYRNIVPFYYRDDNAFILSLANGEKLVPTLPTYKVYQKSLKEKKQQ